MRIDGAITELREKIDLDKKKKHTIEVVVDRLVMKSDHPEAADGFGRNDAAAQATGIVLGALRSGRLQSATTR